MKVIKYRDENNNASIFPPDPTNNMSESDIQLFLEESIQLLRYRDYWRHQKSFIMLKVFFVQMDAL
jgi:hypothetical protein